MALKAKLQRVIALYDRFHADDITSGQNRESLLALLGHYARLLQARENLALQWTDDDDRELREQAGAIETQLKQDGLSEELRNSKTRTLEIVQARIENQKRRAQMGEEIESELSRIEAQFDLALENAAMSSTPQAISSDLAIDLARFDAALSALPREREAAAAGAAPGGGRPRPREELTVAKDPAALPPWARELVGSYESGAACQFILHGNVYDRAAGAGRRRASALGNLRDFLLGVLLAPFDVVLCYDLGNGIRVERGGETFSTWPALQRLGELPRAPRGAVESLTHYLRYTANLARLGKPAPRVAVLLEAAELIAPAGDAGGYDQGAIVLLLREWANDSLIGGHQIATFLVAENLNDLHPLLANNAHAAKIKVPLPDEAALGETLRVLEPAYAAALAGYAGRLDSLAHQLAGRRARVPWSNC